MTREQRTHILRGLKKNSPVKYIGRDIKDAKGERVIIKQFSTGFKIRNAHGHRIGNVIVVSIAGGKFWYFQYDDVTCKAIEVIERLEGTKNTKQ